jgi:hypothetical protein
MARKTYLPGLYVVLRAAQRYIDRWLPFFQDSLTAQQLACLQATINALAECIPLFLPPPPTP